MASLLQFHPTFFVKLPSKCTSESPNLFSSQKLLLLLCHIEGWCSTFGDPLFCTLFYLCFPIRRKVFLVCKQQIIKQQGELFTTSVFVFWRRRTPIDTDLIAGVCDWRTLQASPSPLDPFVWFEVQFIVGKSILCKTLTGSNFVVLSKTLKIASIAKIRRYLAERLLNAKGRLTRYLASGLGC